MFTSFHSNDDLKSILNHTSPRFERIGRYSKKGLKDVLNQKTIPWNFGLNHENKGVNCVFKNPGRDTRYLNPLLWSPFVAVQITLSPVDPAPTSPYP